MSFGFITFCGKLLWGAFGYFLINMGSNLDFYLESLEAGSKSLLWRMHISEESCSGVSLLEEPSILGCHFFPSWQQLMVGLLLPFFFSSVDTACSGFNFWPSGWKNFTVITHHRKGWCSAYVPGYVSHFRMRLTPYQTFFIPNMEAIPRRLCKNTEDPDNQPAKFVELFLFWGWWPWRHVKNA